MSTRVFPSGAGGVSPDKNEEIFNGTIAVRKKSLVAGNAVYQLSNISTISILDLTTIKQVPVSFWVLLVLGLFLFTLPFNPIKFLSVILLCCAGYIMYLHTKNRVDAKFAMLIIMNSATRLSLMSSDLDTLKFIVRELQKAIEDQDVQPFNIINNNGTLSVVNATGSVVNHGTIMGDVANQV